MPESEMATCLQRDLLVGLVHEFYIGMGMIQDKRQGRPLSQVGYSLSLRRRLDLEVLVSLNVN